MAVSIDEFAKVSPDADLGDGCVIGPYCVVDRNVRIGPGTHLHSHVVVGEHTSIGGDCEIFPFVTLGVQSQDQKYVSGTVTYTKIGDRNIIREFVSIHSGTEAESSTEIGDDCALLAHSHVAHNCKVGNKVIMSHGATLGGHVVIGDRANLGGLCGIHQFCHIGTTALVAGLARVVQDVLPFVIAEGVPATMRIVNKVGMERAGYTADEIRDVRKAFRTLFLRELRLEEAVQRVKDELGDKPYIQLMIDAIESSQRGLARPDTATLEFNTSQ
ncbi:MAG: acyl-ACP--UDP-N-acetylglucosamine O-acyltransferase [Gammaproteobacteria bacterium]|nr:acyl-ACP--UDP-N-acetylglucosamine O-acyltransferase [Gammaproteobacteria bacterium]MYF39113.1 acyl-ACP--UDP-N-acetylglucosamine O-acyltransferase [Gammaproteobacteria bacterium]